VAAKKLDLCNPGTLHAVARRAGLAPQGRLSQNFLIDRAVLDAVVAALEPTAADAVLEIGPGIGTLTGELLEHAGRVLAVDIDEACIRATGITQRASDHLELIHRDALHLDLAALGLPELWLAAGNLPYHITTPVISRLFEAAVPPRRGVFLVQREVAARLAAPPGDWSLATVVVRSIADVERIRDVPPESFDPAPAVHSAIIRLRPQREIDEAARIAVIALAKGAFQMRRKTLRHGIAHAMGTKLAAADEVLSLANIDPGRRPGTLGLTEWRTLATAVSSREPQA